MKNVGMLWKAKRDNDGIPGNLRTMLYKKQNSKLFMVVRLMEIANHIVIVELHAAIKLSNN